MPDLNWKRIGLIIVFVLTFIGLCFAVYFVFFTTTPLPQQNPDPAPAPPLPGPHDELKRDPYSPPDAPGIITPPITPRESVLTPGEGPVAITKIEGGENINPRLASDGSAVLTYDGRDGVFYRITPEGNAQKLTDQTFKGARSVEWDGRGDKAVISFRDDSKIVYDFVRNKQVTLPKHWEDIKFSPAGDRLVFKSMATEIENRWFAVAHADGTNGKLIEHMNDKAGYFIPTWSPSDQIIGLFRDGYDADRQKLYFIGLNGENFKSTIIPGRGLETVWSPKGDQLLMSVYNPTSDYKPELWVMDALGDTIGNNRRRLNLQTWAHKCTYGDAETLYCAVPAQLESGAGIIPAKSDNGPDSIYKIDLTTGVKQKIAEFPEDHVIGKLIISTDQSTMYFQEAYSDELYSVKLK